jgi:[ribosomal protein S18]-alanine N-acetyltransferase
MFMEFIFRPLELPDADKIMSWQYERPYARYDGKTFKWYLQTYLRLPFLSPLLKSYHYAVDDEQGNLVGLFRFSRMPNNRLDIGIALKPDLTGQGNGLAFIEAGLAFGKEHYAPASFSLNVAASNQRAIKVYTRAGFVRVGILPSFSFPGIEMIWDMRRSA